MRWTLLVELDDGRVGFCDIPLDFRRDGMFCAVPLDALVKARLFDAYQALTNLSDPSGPELPESVKKAVSLE